MKCKIITVHVPDFCPEDCRELEISESTDVDLMADNYTIYHTEKEYTCKNEWRCRRLHEQLETRYCADCRDAMKARGEV